MVSPFMTDLPPGKLTSTACNGKTFLTGSAKNTSPTAKNGAIRVIWDRARSATTLIATLLPRYTDCHT